MESKYIPEKCSRSALAPRSRKKQKISRLQGRIRALYQDRINMEAERVSIDRENKALLSEMEFIIKTINALNARHATHSFNRASPKETTNPTASDNGSQHNYESNSYSSEASSPNHTSFTNFSPQPSSARASESPTSTSPQTSPHANKTEQSPIMFTQASPVDLQAMFPEPLSTYLPPAQPHLFPNTYISPAKANTMPAASMNTVPVLKGSDNVFVGGNFLNPFAPAYTLQPQDNNCTSGFDQNYTVPPPVHPYCYPSPAVPLGETAAYAPRQSSDFSIWFQSVLADYTPR